MMWNAYSISEEGWVRGEEQVSIEFDTAWTVPEPVVEELSRRFPALRLRLEYRYEGECLGRSMEFDDGKAGAFILCDPEGNGPGHLEIVIAGE